MLEQKPFLSMLTFLGFQVNSALEEGHGNEILFSDIYNGLESRDLFERLEEKLPGILDLSIFLATDNQAYREQREGVLNALNYAASGMRGDESGKYGVESSGLSLLIAYILEAVQQEYWISDRPHRPHRLSIAP